MLHYHCYQHEPLKYEVAFDPAAGSLVVSGALTTQLILTVADLRTRYGGTELLVYIYSDDAGHVAVGVFPSEAGGLSDARRTFLKEQRPAGRLLLMADLPAVANSWSGPGVRIVTIYSYTDPRELGHAITVSTNEGDLEAAHLAGYLQDNPLRITWAIEKGTVLNAQAI